MSVTSTKNISMFLSCYVMQKVKFITTFERRIRSFSITICYLTNISNANIRIVWRKEKNVIISTLHSYVLFLVFLNILPPFDLHALFNAITSLFILLTCASCLFLSHVVLMICIRLSSKSSVCDTSQNCE